MFTRKIDKHLHSILIKNMYKFFWEVNQFIEPDQKNKPKNSTLFANIQHATRGPKSGPGDQRSTAIKPQRARPIVKNQIDDDSKWARSTWEY